MIEKAVAPCKCACWSEEGAHLLGFEWTVEWTSNQGGLWQSSAYEESRLSIFRG